MSTLEECANLREHCWGWNFFHLWLMGRNRYIAIRQKFKFVVLTVVSYHDGVKRIRHAEQLYKCGLI